MPTYQYACTSNDCGLRFERVQSFTEAAISECPQCTERVRKVYGSVGVVFKGSGFYRNDSREAKVGSAPAKSDSSGDSAGSSESKSDKPKSDKPKSDSAASGESKAPAKSSESSKPAAVSNSS